MMPSGYTHCACYSCFEIAISDDDTIPALCHECEYAGCSGEECDDCLIDLDCEES